MLQTIRALRTAVTCVLLASVWWWGSPLQAKTFEEESPGLVQVLSKRLLEKKKTKIAVLDFTDIQSRPNELGRFLAEQLSVDMVMADGITVMDRANINAIMAEHKLTAEGLVNPENAKKLGQFAGVDAILTGNLAALENSVALTVKAISTDTAEVLAAGKIRLDVNKDIQRMLGQGLPSGAGSSAGTSAAPVPQGTFEVGPLAVVVKQVNAGMVEGAPQIRISFDLENRDLANFVAVSANCLLDTSERRPMPRVGGINGVLLDSNERKWQIPRGGLRGIPVVYCFETECEGCGTISGGRIHVTQNAASNVVDYIKNATKFDGDGALEVKTQRVWTGSFASIDPGKKIEMAIVFQPFNKAAANRSATQGERISLPDFADLSLELVIATHREGEKPEKARNLTLRNLEISRLVLLNPNASDPK